MRKNMRPGEYRRYDQLSDEVFNTKSCKIVEIGTWKGLTALEMIKAAKRCHDSSLISYIGFDLFEKMNNDILKKEVSKRPPTKEEVRKKLEDTGVSIELHRGFTTATLPPFVQKLKESQVHPDLIYIDGGHSLETVAFDWSQIKEIMGEGTVVIFDDYLSPKQNWGCNEVIESLDASTYQVSILPVIDNIDNKFNIQLVKVTLRRS